MQIKLNRLVCFSLLLLLTAMITGIGSADEVNLEFVGKFTGTSIRDVAISENYAYLATDNNGLVILDISNPSSPTQRGTCDTAGQSNSVTVLGNFAYIADGSEGLVIVDITSPAAPKIKGSCDTPGNAEKVAIVGNYAYVADGASGLTIVDITNPSVPTIKGGYQIEAEAYDVSVLGNYAYLIDECSLYIINIINPSAPKLEGRYDIGGRAYGIDISGNQAYVADFYNGLVIVDITVPSSPVLVYNHNAYSYNTFINGIDIESSDNYAYIASVDCLFVMNIANPSTPILAGDYNAVPCDIIDVVGNYVYVADGKGVLTILRTDLQNLDRAPEFASLASKTIDENSLLEFTISATDSDGDVISYSATSLPIGATLDSTTGVFRWTPTFDQAGIYDVTFVATANSVPVSKTVTITVINVNNGPVFAHIADITVGENELLSFIVLATADDPNVVISYSAENLPTGATFDANTHVFSWTPGAGTAGSYRVRFIAAANGEYDEETITITVTPVDKTNLVTAVTAANAKITSAIAGTEIGQYPQSAITAFQTAINTAQAVADNPGVTQTQVDQAETNLQAAETTFDAARITSIDKSALTSAIVTANAKVASAVAGTGTGQYPQASIDEFKAAIAIAQAVADNPNATNAEVSQAVTALKAAETTFDASRQVPPASVTNLRETATGTSWIYWTWTNPNDADFSNVMVYIDGVLVTSTPNNYYNATGLPEGSVHTIGTQTVDTAGNINPSTVTDQATTNADTTPPASVINLKESYVGVDWIRWTWEYPGSEDFWSDIYIDGKFVETVTGFSYAASGFPEGTTHTISIQTKDYDENINSTFVNDSATTLTADKANVKLVGSYDTTDRAEGIEISGKYAYVITNPYGIGGHNAYLEIVDITNPSSPKIAGNCVPGFSIDSSVYAHDIDIYGTYAYISSYSHLFIVDINNPSAPKVVNVINPYYSIQDVAISGNYAYIASAEGLLIWDLTNPVIPKQVSSYDTAGSANKVAVEGNYAYVAHGGFSILDITNPSSPKLVSYEGGWVEDFAISGNYAYLFDVMFTGVGNLDYWTAFITVMDISNPSTPKVVNGLSFGDLFDESYISDVGGSGNSAYVADLYNGLFIMDIGNLLDSTLSGSCSSYYIGSATDIEISDNYLYVAGSNGLSILSIDAAPVTTPTTVSYAPLYDNRLRQLSATSVLSTTAYLDIGKSSSVCRDVMLFDLSSYKTTDKISKATLSLYWYYPAGATRTSDTVVEIYRPVEWDPKYVTWNSRMSGVLWGTAGGSWFDKNGASQGTTPYASLTFPAGKVPDNKYYEFDVTQLVQEYVSGKYKNTGFFLKAKTENGNYIAFYSADASNAAVRPKLTVTSTSGSTSTDSAPVANAGADKTATVGSAVTFDASASTDDKGIASYSWDFDSSNGITSEANTVSATKTYTTAGAYTVTLTVTDTIGQKSTDTLQVIVSAATTPASTVSYAPLYDNRLRESSATTVLSTTGYIDIGKTTSSYRDVMLFDLSSYKTTDTISKATLSLYWYYPAGKTRTSDTIVEIYRPLDWDPQYVTWNSRLSGTLWSTAGGNWFDKNGVSQGSTPYASLTFAGSKVPDNKYYEFDVTSLVQEYVSGKYKNTGFFLKAKTESGNYIAFYSNDWSNAAQRPKLTITSTSGSTPVDTAPVANAGADKTATTGSSVTFDGSASTDDKGITSYSWDFDASNGITSEATTRTASKTYTTAGTYTVTLTVTDTIGQKSTDTLQVVVNNPIDQLPVANAGADKTATTSSVVTFDGSASTDDKGITSYSWDFDASNGVASEATGVMTAKAYTTAGTYTVTLTVTDTIGQKSSDTLQVVVSNPVSSVSYAPVYDNRLRESLPTTVLSTTAYLDIGKSSSSCRDVMLFDLSSYKTTDTISKATLSLYWYYPAGATRTSDTVVEIYRPVEWDPKYVTWNSRMSGVLWSNAGGNWYDKNGVAQGTTPYASLTFAGSKVPDNKYYEFDVTQLVQDYISGKYKNTGFFLKAKTESGNYIAFYSLESSNAAQRPKLTIAR